MESLNDVGSITYFNADGSIHETVTFNNQERYLEEAKEALKTRGITGWKCNTLSKDLNLHYELYKMIADEVDDDAMSRGEYARQHPELQKTEEIERTTQAAIRTDSKYQQAEQRRPKVSNLTNAIKEKISFTEYAAMLGYHVIATYTTALFNNSAYKFLFYPGEIDLPKVKDQLDLKAGEIEKIRNPNQKHCLVKAGDDKYYIQVGSLPYENELFGKAGG